jgi:hypothetical protein
MSLRARAAGATAVLAVSLACAGPAIARADSAGPTLEFDRTRVDLVVGDKFHLITTVTNDGSAPTPPFIAHLNVASLTSDVYVDPEDWSPSRSKLVASLAPGASTTVRWDLQAVNSGWFDVYVVLLPDGSTTLGSGPLSVSPPVFAVIGGRQTANPGGALPVVIGVPAAIGIGLLRVRMRRRRRRRYAPDGSSGRPRE